MVWCSTRQWALLTVLGIGLLAAFAAVLAPAPARAEVPVASDVRLGTHSDETRFVIELTGAVDYSIFTLADPYRVVIDLPEVGWQLKPGQELDGKGVIDGFRYGLFQPGNSRVVLDLNAPAVIGGRFTLPPDGPFGFRIVLDLKPASRETFLASAGWPQRSAARTPAARPEPVPQAEDRRRKWPKLVVLDPGHGGVDSGAPGVGGSYEKDIVLNFARTLREHLEDTGRYKVVMTRDRDIYIPLRDRVDIARRHNADLFISLHADSIDKRTVRGASVYTLSDRASDAEAAALAAKENKADIIAGVDLSVESQDVANILIDLAQRDTNNQSVKFAKTLIPALSERTRVLRNTHRFAGFRVLKAPDVPSVLVELGYMSNRDDEAQFKSSRWRRGVADGMVGAIDGYFEKKYAEWPQ